MSVLILLWTNIYNSVSYIYIYIFFSLKFYKWCVCVCVGALQSYLSQVMSLHYTEKPDYSALKQDLNKSLQDLGGTLRDALICR